METKSRKQHSCTLCAHAIEKGVTYYNERLTPWSHAENECFFDFKAHLDCYQVWEVIGKESDWIFQDPFDFREYKQELEQNTNAVGVED